MRGKGSPNGLAIRHALGCNLPPLRQAALQVLEHVIKRADGSTQQICYVLDVDESTYRRWLSQFPEVRKLHLRHRRGIRGPLPGYRMVPKERYK